MIVNRYEFAKQIAEDHNIDLYQKHKKSINDFPIVNGKRKIRAFYDAIIVDDQENEFPYMLDNNQRNEEKLLDFDHIYIIRVKPLSQIIEESGAIVKSEPCKICEGGGWTSQGKRYYYKDLECEF